MRERISIEVSAADRERLAAVVADRNSPQKHVWRARIILATAVGYGTAEIMRRAGVSPGSSMSAGLLAPPGDVIMGFLRSAHRWRRAPGDGPDKACQLPRDRGSDDIGRLAAASELAIAGAQPQLCFPGDLADRPGRRLLPEP